MNINMCIFIKRTAKTWIISPNYLNILFYLQILCTLLPLRRYKSVSLFLKEKLLISSNTWKNTVASCIQWHVVFYMQKTTIIESIFFLYIYTLCAPVIPVIRIKLCIFIWHNYSNYKNYANRYVNTLCP